MVFIALWACKDSGASEELAAELPAEFVQFYHAFHQDSTFQVEHIVFPLEGIPAMADSLTLARDKYRWPKAGWKIHKPLDPERGDFRRKFFMMDDQLIIETISQAESQFAMQRRFAKLGDDWFLIYYAGMNPVKE